MAQRRADRVGGTRTAFDHNRQVILKTQTVCGICGQPVDFGFKFPHPLSPTVDHIVPIALGGHPSDLANLQLAHFWCNRQKSDKLFAKSFKNEEEKQIKNDDLPWSTDWTKFAAR